MRQRKDPQLAMNAMIALLDRGYGRPPQAVHAQVGGDETVRYEITWGPAKGSAVATIDATVANGDAEEVEVVWGDGTRAA